LHLSSAFSYQASDKIASILSLSKSGKSIILDRADFKLNEPNLSFLIGQKTIKGKKGERVYVPMALLSLVKKGSKNSLWSVIKRYEGSNIKKNSKYILLVMTDLLKGRAALKIKRKKVLVEKNEIAKASRESLSYYSDSRSKRLDRYYENKVLHEDRPDVDYSFKLIDIEEPKVAKEIFSKPALYKSPTNQRFKVKRDITLFNKMVLAFLNKANTKQRDLDAFYANSKRSLTTDMISEDGLTLTMMDKVKIDDRKGQANRNKVAKEYLAKGKSWSDSLSDEELSEVLYNVGSLQEDNRRRQIVAHRFNHQVYGSMMFGLVNNQTSQSTAISNTPYALSFGIESFFMKNFKNLNRYSFEFSTRYANDAITISNTNVSFAELSLATHINWYPFNRPVVTNRPILFFGLTARAGFSTLATVNGQDKASYQSLVLPGLRAGFKYNFSNAFGFRTLFSFEKSKLGLVGSSGSNILASSASYTDSKLSIDLTKFY
jgi:hypothetical protein